MKAKKNALAQRIIRPESLELDAVKDAMERALMETTGSRVKLALTPSDVHDPTEIPTYLAGYSPMTYRARDLSPVVPVAKNEDKYRNFSSDDAFQQVDVKMAGQSHVPEIDPRSSLDQYSVVQRAAASFVPAEVEQQAAPLYRPRFAGARRAMLAVELDIEVDVLGTGGLLTTNTNFATGVRLALTAGQHWNGGSASDPIADMMTLHELTAQPISHYAMNLKVVNAFIRHEKVRDHLRMVLGDQGFAQALGGLAEANARGNRFDFAIPGIGMVRVVASKVKNESTGLNDFVMPNVVVAVTTPEGGVPTDGQDIATSYTFRRLSPISGQEFESREFRVEGRGAYGGTMVVVAEASDSKIVANDAGGIITGVISS